MIATALTIAGSDPSGGAGIQADLKTFHRFGAYGMSVVTLLTVQNTQTVAAVEPLDLQRWFGISWTTVTSDIPPLATKTGALGTSAIIEVVAEWAKDADCPLVVDPVMSSKHGVPLIAQEARDTLARNLLPHCYLVTPNLHEAAALTGREVTQ